MKNFKRLFAAAALTLLFILVRPALHFFHYDSSSGLFAVIYSLAPVLIIMTVAWSLIELVGVFKRLLLSRFDVSREDNLASRKAHTQIRLLSRILIFLIVFLAIGAVLFSFDEVRQVGIGLFASAGVAGIIIGLSAQKIMGTLLAGIQIAVTQPFREDDAVVVENEWGWIEEINLTYVVVRLWDKRRLVLPSSYFLEKPFQNWTRTSADIIGSVLIYADYSLPVSALRQELTRLLEASELWDGNVNALQVTEAKETTMELRALVSAKDSPTVWDLRVYVREKLIEFIQKNYPESLPHTRVALRNS